MGSIENGQNFRVKANAGVPPINFDDDDDVDDENDYKKLLAPAHDFDNVSGYDYLF